MIYFRIFTILLATAFMLSFSMVTSQQSRHCWPVCVEVSSLWWPPQNNASFRLKAVEKA